MNDYERIAQIIRFLDERHAEQPDLTVLAGRAGLSPFHFHRLFSTWAGITPKDFLQCLTLAHAKELLRAGESILDVALESGLSGPGRLHDLCVNLEAASPGEMKSGGEGWTISFGLADGPFGKCLIAESPRGICHLSFAETEKPALARLQKDWPQRKIETRRFRRRKNCRTAFSPARVGDRRSAARIRPRHDVSGARLAGTIAGSIWHAHELRTAGKFHRQTHSIARRGHCGRPKSPRLSHSLPSRHPRDGRHWRLSLGRDPKARDDCLGRFATVRQCFGTGKPVNG